MIGFWRRGVARRKRARHEHPGSMTTLRVGGEQAMVPGGFLEMCPSLGILETWGHTGEKKDVCGQNKLPY